MLGKYQHKGLTYDDLLNFFNKIPTIKPQDGLALLGAFWRWNNRYSYLDVVKVQDIHVPTVLGAYLMTLKV